MSGRTDAGSGEDEKVTLRQRLHAATGDRDAEAKALADESDDDVSVDDAKVAVQLARGERGAVAPELEHDIATPADAEVVSEVRDGTDDDRAAEGPRGG